MSLLTAAVAKLRMPGGIASSLRQKVFTDGTTDVPAVVVLDQYGNPTQGQGLVLEELLSEMRLVRRHLELITGAELELGDET